MKKEPAYTIEHRVRYGETDQMGTFYNSRALDWFEFGRTELLRYLGIPYAEIEKKGIFLPVIEAHIYFLGQARYDDLLLITTSMEFAGKARLRFDVEVKHKENQKDIVKGYTIHAFIDQKSKPIRPPDWLIEKLINKL